VLSRAVGSGSFRLAVGLALAVAAVLLPPELFTASWIQILAQGVVLSVAVVGYNLLFSAGQLSLGHAFFIGLGGFSYAFFAGESTDTLGGLGLPPLLALILAVLVAGAAGLAFTPISSRLGGLGLGAASLALVFLGTHIFSNAKSFTGGAFGRAAEPFAFLGFEVSGLRQVWYFTVVVALGAYWFGGHLAKSRVGLGLNAIRDGELFASAMGVRVRRYKVQAFVVSAMYAGLAGAMLATVAGVLVPETFGLVLSLNILMMSVLGGSAYVVAGAVVGALIFQLLPEILTRNSQLLPFVSTDPLAGGLTPADAANYIYGAAIVAILILWPNGVVALFTRLAANLRRRRARPPAGPTSGTTDTATDDLLKEPSS
jgi:branched-chain amino acid transport system permease protein